jgi:phosphate transport system permease protein
VEKFRIVTAAFTGSIAVLALLLLVELAISAYPAIDEFGFRFLIETAWDPVMEVYGALPFIYGTMMTSAISLLMAIPLSVGAAVFLTHYVPPKVSYALSFLIGIIAAISSVIIGLWGIFVLIPWVRESLGPFLIENLGFIPLFRGPVYGPSLLSGAIILGIMIIPIITSISKDAKNAVPNQQKEVMLELCSTKSQWITAIVLPYT